MATKDISRRLFRPTQRYLGARMQSGRVLLDSCWNEGDDERAEARRRITSDQVGCSGSPDCGFRLSFCSPYSIISPGVMYAGGMRFQLDAPRYLMGQPDLLKGPLLELFQRGEIELDWQPSFPMLVYLEGFEAPVTPTEDRELFDPALGGVDTTVRNRRFARVLFDPREPDEDATCESLWQRFATDPPFCPGARLEDDCTLTSPVRLTVGFVDDLEADDECERCEPGFRRGYRLAEPEAIRVMLTRDGKSFTWGFENAAPLLRVNVVGKQVELLTAPRDEFHAPQPGQTVEILSWGALLPNGEKTAEPVGWFTTIEQVQGNILVLADDPTFQVTRVHPLLRGQYPEAEQHAIQCDTHFYMRLWRRGADRESPATQPIVADDGATEHRLGFTGLTVRFDFDTGAKHGCSGDYWVVAARPEHSAVVVPWTLLEGERPHGPRRAYAPLAIARLVPNQLEELNAVTGGGFVATATTQTSSSALPTTQTGGFVVANVATVSGVAAGVGNLAAADSPCDDLGVGLVAATGFSCTPSSTSNVTAAGSQSNVLQRVGLGDEQGPVELVYQDCRRRFRPLTRRNGCCTVTAGPGCAYETLQDAIDALPGEGGRVCLVRGTLSGRVVIEGRRDIEIVGSGPSSIVTVDEEAPGTEPVIDVRDCERITFRSLAVVAHGVLGIRVWRTAGSETPSATRLREVTVRAQSHVGATVSGARAAVSIVNGDGDRIERCQLEMDGTATGLEPIVYVWGNDQRVRDSKLLTTSGDDAIAWGGLQIDGGSKRVRIVDNRIEAGLGHGITLGGVATHDSPPPEPPLSESDRMTIGSTMVDTTGAAPVVRLHPAPAGVQVAVPTGALSRIELRRNVIVGMGTSGIAVAGFFDGSLPEPASPYVLVDRLEIVDNTIEENLRSAPQYPTLTSLDAVSTAAAGGIVLGAAYRTRIRGNVIRSNGSLREEPVVGVFVQLGVVEIIRNQIDGNGLNLVTAEASSPTLGVRSGIAIPRVVVPLDPDTGHPIAMPGARIVDNVIRVPEGKALQVSTVAGLAIQRNDMHTRGDNAPLDFPTQYEVIVGDLSSVGSGAAVDVRGLLDIPHAVDPDQPATGGTAGTDPFGGAILFEDNQITLDWPDKDSGTTVSSVIIATHESTVSFLRNQLLTRTHAPLPAEAEFAEFVSESSNNTPTLVVCPCIVEGFAVQVSDNRINEGYFESGISALVWTLGFGNVTAQNASTHCVVVGATGAGIVPIDLLNDELVNTEVVGGAPFCETLSVGRTVAGELVSYTIS
ncbi:hypothetical protein [Paraliomyxa miuraensis]|uniref:hypothetical protein n=1 Tax=Paraliomyxa miuraensis TaxID=376150 RepID=UPI0022510583|nr:hypothetical protein [Paraliomyxa miuraensis]MCX4247457.1 right-handed parallel beta-helix repeat-containing protein [Paraliomyxa miuraensis]